METLEAVEKDPAASASTGTAEAPAVAARPTRSNSAQIALEPTALSNRLETMLLGNHPVPAPSNEVSVASEVSNGIILAAKAAVDALFSSPQRNALMALGLRDLKKAALAYLVWDLRGVLAGARHGQAVAYGKRIQTHAAGVEKEQGLRKRRRVDGAEEALLAAVPAVLQDVPTPEADNGPDPEPTPPAALAAEATGEAARAADGSARAAAARAAAARGAAARAGPATEVVTRAAKATGEAARATDGSARAAAATEVVARAAEATGEAALATTSVAAAPLPPCRHRRPPSPGEYEELPLAAAARRGIGSPSPLGPKERRWLEARAARLDAEIDRRREAEARAADAADKFFALGAAAEAKVTAAEAERADAADAAAEALARRLLEMEALVRRQSESLRAAAAVPDPDELGIANREIDSLRKQLHSMTGELVHVEAELAAARRELAAARRAWPHVGGGRLRA